MGDTVVLTSDKVKSPVAFRYAWHKLAEPNLTGGSGLPVGAVRGGRVPDFLDSVPGADKYQLVYDLDLSNLGANINYVPHNQQGVPHASNTAYDFGDAPAGEPNGYGSMQIHNPEQKKTIFAINHWSQGTNADLGISNSQGRNLDWTFSGNASTYTTKRLRVYVRPK